jgi:hypothetical protein
LIATTNIKSWILTIYKTLGNELALSINILNLLWSNVFSLS